MTESHKYTIYAATEERINIYFDRVGFLASLFALVILTVKANGLLQIASVTVFATSLATGTFRSMYSYCNNG